MLRPLTILPITDKKIQIIDTKQFYLIRTVRLDYSAKFSMPSDSLEIEIVPETMSLERRDKQLVAREKCSSPNCGLDPINSVLSTRDSLGSNMSINRVLVRAHLSGLRPSFTTRWCESRTVLNYGSEFRL